MEEKYPKIKIPDRIGKYEYVKTLGKGSFSVVYLVYDPTTNMHFACKTVSRQQLIEEQIYNRFEQEIRVLQSLHHPNIVQIFDIIYLADTISVIMEYCRNGELFQYIAAHGPLPDPQLFSTFRQITAAIAYCHSRNIAHRDIKPENILLDDKNSPKLADFGLCHVANKNILLATPCGSPFYAPPEIIQNKPYNGLQSDIWSLGVVFYAMATGSLPWTEMTQTALFLQIESAEIPIPSTLSPYVQQLLRLMLTREPSMRPTANEILQMPFLKDNDDDSEEFVSSPFDKASSMLYKEKHTSDSPIPSPVTRRKPAYIIKPEAPNSSKRRSLNVESVLIRKVAPRNPSSAHRSAMVQPSTLFPA